MFWNYIFPFSFAFPLVHMVLPLVLFFLAIGIRVFFSSLFDLDPEYCGFEKGSTIPLPYFLLPVLPNAHPSVSFFTLPILFTEDADVSGNNKVMRKQWPCNFWSLFVFSPSANAFSGDDEDDGNEGVLC
ncbi:hypothetical protein NC653_010679 [Populus alba x Populus x berolinensis]|uniref:Uncharacterized protein n=1 Tax=Populus alba x Populus x berolinensis TaxID=444605 RepID=A0AAD6W6N1_9ROSI|nr:hypothetical protein NC653_010679 [Populus alba x Populus x berolinensis]